MLLQRLWNGLAWEDSADFVVVGTGAGGATAARVLAEQGHDVLMLEEGPRLRAKDRPRDAVGALGRTMRAGATQAAMGSNGAVPVLQAVCVGGSTAVNSGIVWRMPEDVREDWTQRYGLGSLVDAAAFERIYQRIESDLEVADTDANQLGGNASLMAKASDALGLPGKPMARNAGRCEGSSECLQGCPNEKRQSMDTSYVPAALRDGARLKDLCRVEKVWVENGRAVGVIGQVLDRESRRPVGGFRVRAKNVIVSAGVVHTPILLQRSGVKGPVGRRFQAHPGAAIVGRFAKPVRMAYGATQGWEVPQRERGYKLESLSLPPEMLAARLPGVGQSWQRRMAQMDHYAQWCAQVRMEAHGRIFDSPVGPFITYSPTRRDLDKAQEAMCLIMKMMFEVGAEEVYPGIVGLPEVMTRPEEVEEVARRRWDRGSIHLVASHLFGTATAGADPRRSVVGADLQCHSTPGLYVMDASVFPTNMGVNPQHSIMAVVYRAAEALGERAAMRRAS